MPPKGFGKCIFLFPSSLLKLCKYLDSCLQTSSSALFSFSSFLLPGYKSCCSLCLALIPYVNPSRRGWSQSVKKKKKKKKTCTHTFRAGSCYIEERWWWWCTYGVVALSSTSPPPESSTLWSLLGNTHENIPSLHILSFFLIWVCVSSLINKTNYQVMPNVYLHLWAVDRIGTTNQPGKGKSTFSISKKLAHCNRLYLSHAPRMLEYSGSVCVCVCLAVMSLITVAHNHGCICVLWWP